MGRDKTVKPAAPEVKAEVIIGLDGKPQRPPRGIRILHYWCDSEQDNDTSSDNCDSNSK